jgi:hypothetical protein
MGHPGRAGHSRSLRPAALGLGRSPSPTANPASKTTASSPGGAALEGISLGGREDTVKSPFARRLPAASAPASYWNLDQTRSNSLGARSWRGSERTGRARHTPWFRGSLGWRTRSSPSCSRSASSGSRLRRIERSLSSPRGPKRRGSTSSAPACTIEGASDRLALVRPVAGYVYGDLT